VSKDTSASKAEQAAREALESLQSCIDYRKPFVLEAGAGAGKTYSLVHALNYIINRKGAELIKRGQQVACITYTNVARDEIESRTAGHKAVYSGTIHSFCWSLISRFQPALREELPSIGRWSERLAESGEIGSRRVDYDLGYPSAKKEDHVSLGHDDVLALAVRLLERLKFRHLLTDRYPIIFIDEYQDTDAGVVEALKTHVLDTGEGPFLGFFGDHWQKIYGNGCGKIEHSALERIDKHANFRSVGCVVEMLNCIRPELPQVSSNPEGAGSLAVYHSNDWKGERRTKFPWNGDLPPQQAHDHLEAAKRHLEKQGWDFSQPDNTKILMLTHNILADEQGYRQLADVFSRNEAFIKKEDDRIAFFADILEPACAAYSERRFGEMFAVLGGRRPAIQSLAEKRKWACDMDRLLELREAGSVGDVLDHLMKTHRPRLPSSVEHDEHELRRLADPPDTDKPDWAERLDRLREVPYKQVELVASFINGQTPFSTKHGVKGAQFQNVLVVVGRGWGLYDFNQMLEYSTVGIPSDAKKRDAFERARNLFYVCCSRSEKRVAVLFTQLLSDKALTALQSWFGSENVKPLSLS
jgi:DNA helicase-2/ATP-dependent DNA helicase PcrA